MLISTHIFAHIFYFLYILIGFFLAKENDAKRAFLLIIFACTHYISDRSNRGKRSNEVETMHIIIS